jgi:hypothetical protein
MKIRLAASLLAAGIAVTELSRRQGFAYGTVTA